MENFKSWSKEKQNKIHETKFGDRTHLQIDKSNFIFGKTHSEFMLPIEDCKKLIKLEKFLKDNPEITDEQFDEMLEHPNMRKFKTLLSGYLPVDGGIASDIRNDGWQMISMYLAKEHKINEQYAEIMKDNQREERYEKRHEKLSKFVRPILKLKESLKKPTEETQEKTQNNADGLSM